MRKLSVIILLGLLVVAGAGCAVSNLNSKSKKKWFIGWGKHKLPSGEEIESAPPLKFPDVKIGG